jgi:hypothetical protein
MVLQYTKVLHMHDEMKEKNGKARLAETKHISQCEDRANTLGDGAGALTRASS